MKCILSLIFAVGVLTSGHSQSAFIGGNFGHMRMTGYDARNYGGLDLQIEADNHFGFSYSIYAGPRYFHAPGSLFLALGVGGAIAASGDSTSSGRGALGLITGLLIAAIPEGVFYRFEFTQRFGISPYINPLQFDIIKDEKIDESAWSFGASAGLRLNFYTKNLNWRWCPYFDYKVSYNEPGVRGPTFGLSLQRKLK